MSYKYVYPPFGHQAEGIQLLRGRTHYGFFDEPGCGKSKLVVDAANLLFLDRAIGAVLVVVPNTVKATWCNEVWGQIATHTPKDFPYEVFRLDSGKRWPELSKIDALKGQKLVWVVTNYEALRSAKQEKWLATFLAKFAPSMMVLDESTKVKNGAALQTKSAIRLGGFAARRYILTGTPVARNPLDLHSQFMFLDPWILGPSKVNFRNRYAVMGGYMVMGRPVQVVGWKNLDELKERISKHSRVVEKRVALPDLPDKLFQTIELPLSDEQASAYEQMRDNAVASFPGAIGQATASIALTKMLRLQQITSGHLPIKHSVTGHDQICVFPHNPKYDFVMELLEDQVDYLVVFGNFIEELQGMAKRLKDAGISHGLIYGDTKLKDRETIQEDYQKGSLRVVLCQIVTGGIGLTLVQGSTAVYLSNHFSYEVRTQSSDRLHRPGQKNNVLYYDLIATCNGKKTVDHTVMKAIGVKENLSDYVLGHTIEDLA
jgi:SNF2 family DNA or RNA helicase